MVNASSVPPFLVKIVLEVSTQQLKILVDAQEAIHSILKPKCVNVLMMPIPTYRHLNYVILVLDFKIVLKHLMIKELDAIVTILLLTA